MYRDQDKDTKVQFPTALERGPGGQAARHDAARSDAGPLGDAKSARRWTLPRPAFSKRTIIAGALAVALAVGGGAGVHWWVSGRFVISTDDAYVRAHNTTLASKISGYVASIPIEDNATVRAGDVIATIDDGDYRLAADAAREKVATQQATVDRIGRQVIAQNATIDQAKAQMVSAQAAAKRMQLELDRQQALA